MATAYAKTHARYAQIESSERAIKSSMQAFQEDVMRTKNGKGLPIEVLDSLRLLGRSRQAYLDAIADYNRAHFKLYVALGQPPANMLRAPGPDRQRRPQRPQGASAAIAALLHRPRMDRRLSLRERTQRRLSLRERTSFRGAKDDVAAQRTTGCTARMLGMTQQHENRLRSQSKRRLRYWRRLLIALTTTAAGCQTGTTIQDRNVLAMAGVVQTLNNEPIGALANQALTILWQLAIPLRPTTSPLPLYSGGVGRGDGGQHPSRQPEIVANDLHPRTASRPRPSDTRNRRRKDH